ncbi:hypothetical protein TVAG_356450 [Trichomonas vaginalis G3]|uniref:Uncharacterized protein n=1 Tax=Trichomonas vaginalis (strain ATCC PRA-98 / G3) TaxID=412133 RepID=A2FM64_TRIV3|nr:hypothetical protein TVAGG3_0152630 [Trichomonas vaginalis G3]EAX93998.1 hypothetical protein TVAG_356450 [Trichomonas vaginalis G3]KAI5547379.1 hypothetical protein TVAGG3_0152630 [Trichomonas vaginalis G3]|eukprot:XP_001306928.1 hypothetical protein [Trichomonas vaginalis G3]
MFVVFTFKVAKVDDFLNIQHQVEAINSQNQCKLAFVTTDDEIKKLKSGQTKELNVKLILSDNLAVQRFCKVLKNERDAEIAQQRRENLQNIKLALAAEQEQNDSTVEKPNEPYFEIIWPDYIPEITKQTINVLLGNIMAKSSHGFRFENDPIVLDLAFLIETKSESAYEQLRRFISLFPSRMTLFNYFADPINNMKDFLLHPECLDKMLSYMNYQIPDGGRFAIALDAVELKSLVISKDKNFQSLDIKDLFVFLALPLNFEAPNFVASILPYKNGFASSIIGKIQAVIDQLSYFIEISYIFTDGDPGYKEKQQEFIKELKKAKNIDELIQIAQNYIEHHQVWSVDIVHLSKRDRKFFIRKDVELYAIPFNKDSRIQAEKLKEVVKLGDALEDQSGLGAMKDKYAIAIFSMFCLEKLLQAGYYNEALFIAPFSLWYESIRNEVINFDTRMFMLITAVHLVMSILCKHDEMGIKNNFQTEERGEINVKFKFIANEIMLEQMLRALSVFIVEFNRNQNLNFSHLTTMTEEHLFGLLRVMSHFKYDLDTAMTILYRKGSLEKVTFGAKIIFKKNLFLLFNQYYTITYYFFISNPYYFSEWKFL